VALFMGYKIARWGACVIAASVRLGATPAQPRTWPLAAMAARRARCDPHAVPPRTLIVDDNAHFLKAASDLLRREGIPVVGVASTTDEALRRAAELQPDVTLVDVYLGAESGVELAWRLSAQHVAGPSRVILISTYAESDFPDLVTASPAVGFVSKAELSASAIHRLLEG
jgi:CheY-like chemotaxis protein